MRRSPTAECLRCGRRDALYLDGAPRPGPDGRIERERRVECPTCGLRSQVYRDEGPATKRYVVRVTWTRRAGGGT